MPLDPLFFLHIFAILFIIIGLGVFFNPKYYLALLKESYSHHFFIYFAGLVSIISGAILMQLFMDFDKNEDIFFFFLGAIILAKGLFFIECPRGIAVHHKKLFSKSRSIRILGAITFAFGSPCFIFS